MRVVFQQFYRADGSIPVEKPEYVTAGDGPFPEKDEYFVLRRLEGIPEGKTVRGYVTSRSWSFDGDQRIITINFRPPTDD